MQFVRIFNVKQIISILHRYLLWAAPADPPTPTPSSLNLSLTTCECSNTQPNSVTQHTPPSNNPLFVDSWPPISPILPCSHKSYLNEIPNMNDTHTYESNNHTLNDLPQNITIMNDTYISYNFYKI